MAYRIDLQRFQDLDETEHQARRLEAKRSILRDKERKPDQLYCFQGKAVFDVVLEEVFFITFVGPSHDNPYFLQINSTMNGFMTNYEEKDLKTSINKYKRTTTFQEALANGGYLSPEN